MTSVVLFWPSLSHCQDSQIETIMQVVFDLDWTLINPTTEAMAIAEPKGILRVNGKIYRLAPHAIEILIALHQTPGTEVSFFSGGDTDRNKKLISEIYALIDRQTGTSIYRPKLILSFEDLKQRSNDPKLKFIERFEKDLSRNFDLQKAVLVEDIHNFVPTGQEQNVLYLGKTYNDRVEYGLDHLEDPKESRYKAPNYEEWLRDHNRLSRVLSILLKSRQVALKNQITAVNALQEVLKIEKSVDPSSCGAKLQAPTP